MKETLEAMPDLMSQALLDLFIHAVFDLERVNNASMGESSVAGGHSSGVDFNAVCGVDAGTQPPILACLTEFFLGKLYPLNFVNGLRGRRENGAAGKHKKNGPSHRAVKNSTAFLKVQAPKIST